MNIKKLFATLAGVSLFAQTVVPSASVFGAGYSQELEDAYNWAYGKSITTMSPIENANMYGAITRAEMAKMLANWAKDKGETPDTSKACNFSDTASVKGDLATAIVEACQLGLMGQGITSFRPYDTISRAEFGTALSRALWGNKYEGGTPYYTNHLNALKAAGIMTQIANAESTKEVRGYVMLMLMRSEGGSEVSDETDCDDPLVVLACNSDSDACPAACKEENKDDEDVVKSGDLDVEVSGNSDGKIFIGRDSELDNITLKTSEEVTITKIVLERIGYSTKDNIVSVKLEDDKGATIADAKTLDSKGQVKLTLKKDYKVVDGELNAVIVVKSEDTGTNALKAGATVGFKVVDVESTAKNVNISGKANTYSAIDFAGSTITFNTTVNTAKDYNWSAGEMYEVAKMKVTAPDDSSIVLRGFTFKQLPVGGKTSLDLRKYFDNAELTVAGEKVSGLEASVNKDDELVVTFKDVEVPAKKKSEIILKISLTDDFDSFTNIVKLYLKDFVAVDGKVEARVSAWTPSDTTGYWDFTQYTFRGGKVKLANVKLGNIDAAEDSEDIVIAEGTITLPEAVKWSFYIDVKWEAATAIKQMTFVVNNEETDANPANTPAYVGTTKYSKGALVLAAGTIYESLTDNNLGNAVTNTTNWKELGTVPTVAGTPAVTTLHTTDFVRFYFNNVEIDKSGKIKFMIDTKEGTLWNQKVANFSIFKADSFTTLKYDESNENAKDEVSGSISFSKVTIQPAKASMTNSATKDVEFMNRESSSNRKVVFDGTYTAKKGDIELNKFEITKLASPTTSTQISSNWDLNKVTFYVFVDGTEVADAKYDATANKAGDTFDNIKIKAWESVKIKVEAEVEADNPASPTVTYPLTIGKFQVQVSWEDVNGNSNSGVGTANTVTMKVVEKGTVNISAGAIKETVLYKASNAEVAAFNIKPANGASETDLEEISFILTQDGNDLVSSTETVDGNVTVKVDNVTADDCVKSTTAYKSTTNYPIVCSFNEKVSSNGVDVVISLDNEETGVVKVAGLEINDKAQTREFKKRFESALVWIESMKDLGGTTQFTLGVEKDSELTVRNLTITFDTDEVTPCGWTNPACVRTSTLAKEFDEGDTIEAKGIKDWVRLVTKISYLVSKVGAYAACATEYNEDWTAKGTSDAGGYCLVEITKDASWGDNYADFFKVGDTYARTYKSN